MLARCYFALVVVAASFVALPELVQSCPEASGWFYTPLTKKCYKGLMFERLSYTDAQRRCNQLRSNLFQFDLEDKDVFDELQNALFNYRNTTEFKEESWIGLTDIAKLNSYVYLNGVPLDDIAENVLISCPKSVPNDCQRTNRCIYMNLLRRGLGYDQLFRGNCADKMPVICYAPVGGTDKFDKVPSLSASSTAASLALLSVASGLVAALKYMF